MNTALTGVTAGDWLAVGVGILFGILATVVAIAIARWQRRIQMGDRAQDRAEQQRLARRESWQAQYLETNEVLRLAQQIEWHVRKNGPFTETGLDGLHLTELVMDAEQLAARCPERLREPLEKLAVAATELRQSAVQSPAARGPADGAATNTVLTTATTHAEFRLAVQQDRAAQELAAVIKTGWSALNEEWGH